MKMLVTGAHGFVGRNVVEALKTTCDVTTCGLSARNDIEVDLAQEIPAFSEKYDIVFHAAGKAHGISTKRSDVQGVFDINVKGTKNLCGALGASGIPDVFIFMSSVAVYGCREGENIDESHPLDGTNPYARSKIEAEQFLMQWCEERDVKLGILRAPLIVGSNPPGRLGDMISGIMSGRYLGIGQGRARKSMLMVDDLPVLIDLLRQKGGIYNVCDDSHPSFQEIEKSIARQSGHRRVIRIPHWCASVMAKVGDMLGPNAPLNTDKLNKMTKTLTFSNEKAKRELGWQPSDVLSTFRI